MQTIIVWPDGTWCYLEDVHDFSWKSDDFQRVHLPEEMDSDEIDFVVEQLIGLPAPKVTLQ